MAARAGHRTAADLAYPPDTAEGKETNPMKHTPVNMRALVTGSRTWRDTEAVHTALDTLANSAAATGYSGLVVVHGGAKGADTTAGLWVLDRKRRGWKVRAEVHLADWKRYGNGAGMRRNREMVRRGVDVCVAFLAECESTRCRRPRPHYTHGAADCADLAEASDIHTIRIVPRTRVEFRPTTREDTNP